MLLFQFYHDLIGSIKDGGRVNPCVCRLHKRGAINVEGSGGWRNISQGIQSIGR